jgi:phenylpropionate dioxygenase-like ring-hydroxylating dioxygenase large terminal subunit
VNQAIKEHSQKIEIPVLGLRNYWYPAIARWRLGKKPKAVTLLGEKIVLFRDANNKKVYALADRCSHRGAPLSMGKCLYPGSGTVSCPYHGWTFDGASGKLVAKLMEGGEVPLPARATIKSYAVREHAGYIWLFVGDMEAVPFETDLPDCILNRSEWWSISNWRTYNCNWRLVMDNLSHDQHAPFLHRDSPELLFQPIFKHATRNSTELLENGTGIGHHATHGSHVTNYPGLGAFPPPQEARRRFLKPSGRGKDMDQSSAAVSKYGIKFRHMNVLPSLALIGRPSGDFFTCRFVTPLDANTTMLYSFNLFRRQGSLTALLNSLKWVFWSSWAHDWIFSDQDKYVVEKIRPGPELLSKTDVGLTGWRWFMAKNARRPDQEASDVETATVPMAEVRDDFSKIA